MVMRWFWETELISQANQEPNKGGWGTQREPQWEVIATSRLGGVREEMMCFLQTPGQVDNVEAGVPSQDCQQLVASRVRTVASRAVKVGEDQNPCFSAPSLLSPAGLLLAEPEGCQPLGGPRCLHPQASASLAWSRKGGCREVSGEEPTRTPPKGLFLVETNQQVWQAECDPPKGHGSCCSSGRGCLQIKISHQFRFDC